MANSESQKIDKKAKKVFPGGVNSGARAFKAVENDPIIMEKGDKGFIYDVDGIEYIDHCCSFGPLILGHANLNVNNKVEEYLRKGTSFGATTQIEVNLGDLIVSNHKYIDKIRFVNSGTEATMSAIRTARGHTGKNKLIKFEGCYHGHGDALLVKAGSGLATMGTSSSAGVPEKTAEDTIVLPLNDENAVNEAFNNYGNDIAGMIIEPIPANNGLLIQRKEFLEHLRKKCDEFDTLLIFDEVISGFRVGFEGAAGYYGIQPDLATYGKVIGGGFPVGAFAGKEEIMSSVSPEGNVYQGGTLSGNPIAMAAGYAQISECLKPGFYENLEQKTEKLADNINNEIISLDIESKIHQFASIFWCAFTDKNAVRAVNEIPEETGEKFSTLYNELLQNGIYLGPSGFEVGFVSSAHTEENLSKSANAFVEGLKKIKTKKEKESV